jgi:hypothetical protein
VSWGEAKAKKRRQHFATGTPQAIPQAKLGDVVKISIEKN